VAKPLGAEADPETLISWTRRRLANYKVPRLVFFVDVLPKNASSKVMRDILRERVGELAASRARGSSPGGGMRSGSRSSGSRGWGT
jgi:acyl-coenzyme A synthetase/AMP-(fatty) acid ligase